MSNFKKKAAAFFRGEGFLGTSMTALLIGVVIAFNAIIYALTAGFGLYLYSPEVDDLSISGATDEYFEKINDHGRQVTILFCREKSAIESSSDEVHTFHETALQFAERYPELIRLEYVNIITKRNSSGELVDLTPYQKASDGTSYPLHDYSVIFLSDITYKTVPNIGSATCTYGEDSSGSTALTSYNGEEVCAAMVKWVLESEHKTAYFTTYHGEVSDISFANMLSCAGFEIATIDLKSVSMIPENAGLVVISNPIEDFESAAGNGVFSEIEKLDAYLKDGGNLFVALDPYVERLTELEGLLSRHGIDISYSEDGAKNLIRDSDQGVTVDYFTLISTLSDTELGASIKEKLDKHGSSKVRLKECAALILSGNAEPLLKSSASAELYSGGKKTDGSGNYAMSAVSFTDNENGTRSSVFVVPSVYLTSSDVVVTSSYANRDFVYSVIDRVFGAGAVPYGCNTVYRDSGMLENLTMGTARIYATLIFMIPAAITVVGAVIIIRRKNK